MRSIALALLAAMLGQLHTPGPLEWDPGTDRPKRGSETVLIFLTEYLRARPEVTKFRFETHVAGEGDSAANQRLAERRTLYIAKWFLAHGIDCKRLVPVAVADKSENKTAFINAEVRGKAAAPQTATKPLADLCQLKTTP